MYNIPIESRKTGDSLHSHKYQSNYHWYQKLKESYENMFFEWTTEWILKFDNLYWKYDGSWVLHEMSRYVLNLWSVQTLGYHYTNIMSFWSGDVS